LAPLLRRVARERARRRAEGCAPLRQKLRVVHAAGQNENAVSGIGLVAREAYEERVAFGVLCQRRDERDEVVGGGAALAANRLSSRCQEMACLDERARLESVDDGPDAKLEESPEAVGAIRGRREPEAELRREAHEHASVGGGAAVVGFIYDDTSE